MANHEYTAADITVIEFDESVRKRPGMYFRVGLDNPRLPTEILSTVASHILHPTAGVAESHTLSGLIEVLGDLRLRVTLDEPPAWQDTPALGYYDSLLGFNWWSLATVAALCERTSVEMWRDGQGFRQELAGIRPLAAVERFDPYPGSGMRVTFMLDVGILLPEAAFPAEFEGIDMHGEYCTQEPGPGYVTIRDHRQAGGL
ncbi:hypothetical protein [Nonomuraea sp. NPDC049141]|uniref:hypothetical protein n=1 Tax=Nonomuraea sp. NPDC049141 TaxID=3155500 RepID=UPI0033C196C0